jgi:hypothetical protein
MTIKNNITVVAVNIEVDLNCCCCRDIFLVMIGFEVGHVLVRIVDSFIFLGKIKKFGLVFTSIVHFMKSDRCFTNRYFARGRFAREETFLLTGHFTGEYLISYSPDVRNTQSGDTDCCW